MDRVLNHTLVLYVSGSSVIVVKIEPKHTHVVPMILIPHRVGPYLRQWKNSITGRVGCAVMCNSINTYDIYRKRGYRDGVDVWSLISANSLPILLVVS